MTWLAPIVGVALVLGAFREVFHMLFHPAGQGNLSMLVFRRVWSLAGRLGVGARSLAGPASMALVIALWTASLVLGWALIYWSALPGSFIFASPLRSGQQDGFVDALYFSWVTQSTLGYGDIAPRGGLLRLLAPMQATIGFALFTAAVTWVLSVQPALRRQRSAASLAHSIREGHRRFERPSSDMPPGTLARQMERLSEMVSAARVDFLQHPSTFYFAAPASSLSLAATLPYVAELAQTDRLPQEVRPAAAELASALEQFSAALGEHHLGIEEGETGDVLEAYRRHQGVAAAEGGGR